MPPRIMYIECKSGGLSGPARIGRVAFSRSGRTLHYAGRKFESLKGQGFKANYVDADTGDAYWISGCKKAGGDRLYPGLRDIFARTGLPVPPTSLSGATTITAPVTGSSSRLASCVRP